MNEAGVLGRFVPDFGRVVAQMQFDMYHVYTVDEHTLRAIGILHEHRDRASSPRTIRCPPTVMPQGESRRAPLPGRAAARHRQGPRRRPLGARRARSRATLRAALGLERSRRPRPSPGWCAPPGDERHRPQARHRRSARRSPISPRIVQIAGAAAPAAGADRRRHPRRRPRRLERLEGQLLRELYAAPRKC